MGIEKRCKNCLISAHFPGIKFDEQCVCNICRKFNSSVYGKTIDDVHKKVEEVIKEKRGKGPYDIIVSYSGGKDSSFTLYYLKEKYNLKILALLVDNSFISDKALSNARKMTSELGIDFVIIQPNPQFVCKMFNKSIRKDIYTVQQLSRANAACLSCITLIQGITLNEAIIRRIPIIAGGYVAGQLPSKSGVIYPESKIFQNYREKNKRFLSEHIDEGFMHYLEIPPLVHDQLFPVMINPILGINYKEEDIYTIISNYGWEKPDDTGLSSSNCLINDYAIAVNYEKHKFHAYESEICMQVRQGALSREDALKRLEDIRPSRDFTEIISKLDYYDEKKNRT